MNHIDIDVTALSRIRSADPDQPVTMLNLVRFREHALQGFGVDGFSGIEAFEHYAILNATEGVDGVTSWAQRTGPPARRTHS